MNGLPTVDRHEVAVALGWLAEAGIDCLVGDTPFAWLTPAGTTANPVVPTPVVLAREVAARARGDAINADSLSALAAALVEAHPGSLFADGQPSAAMVIGDRPTNADAKAGKIFAGQAGTLLDRMLASIGQSRGSAYLANTVAWPLPADRIPAAADIEAAAPYLRRQIVLARPRVILAMGQVAASALTGSSEGIIRQRGRWHEVDIDGHQVSVLPTFHPAQLLLHPGHKAHAWLDLCAFQARLDE